MQAILDLVAGKEEKTFFDKVTEGEETKQQYGKGSYAWRLFAVNIIGGGLLLMVISALVVEFSVKVESKGYESRKMECGEDGVYGSNSLLAHIGNAPGTVFTPPLLNAFGTGMLGASLFSDGANVEFKKLVGEDSKMKLAGIFVGAMSMLAASFAQGALSPGRFDSNCDSENQDPTTYGDLLFGDLGLSIAVFLNFLGDGAMVKEALEWKSEKDKPEMRGLGPVIKILADNTILVLILAMRAKQKMAGSENFVFYMITLGALFALFAGGGLALNKKDMVGDKAKSFFEGMVPVILLWTLILELAPASTFFTDDTGSEIKEEVKLKPGMKYVGENDEEKTVDDNLARIFNMREALMNMVTVGTFAVFTYFM